MYKIPLVIFFTLVVSACGGGSDAPATDPNTIFTLFDMNVVKAGTNKSFTISGSDTAGLTYTGTVSLVDRGLTTFMSQSVRRTDFVASIAVGNSGFATATDSVYGDPSTRAVLFKEDDTGFTCTSSTSATIPNTAKPGDFGNTSSLTCADGSTETGAWRLQALTNGQAKLIYTFTYLDSLGNPDGTEEYSYIIDTSGNVLSAVFTFNDPSGLVVTLNAN